METFGLQLSNGAIVAGIYSSPPASASSLKYRPLIIGLHGGSYNCRYFDAMDTHTARIPSSAFGVPFAAIDRPGYGGSTSLIVPEGSDFPQETGRWLHNFILPVLWAEIGIPAGCNCVVLLSHSHGVMGCIVAAALHGLDSNESYPLGGIIASGLGGQFTNEIFENRLPTVPVPANRVLMSAEEKDKLLLRPGSCHPEIFALGDDLNVTSPLAECESLYTFWTQVWRQKWTPHIIAPVLFALADRDCYFEGTDEHVASCVAAFTRSIRAEGSLIKGAPHCMELSYVLTLDFCTTSR
ncbi:hypothetical protein BJX99DRAFT_249738 [Aspergillus californicus]